jgi:outer membrane protein assembly factor BamB
VSSATVVESGQVAIAAAVGRVYVLDLAKGTALEQFDAGSPFSTSPAVVANRLVLGTQDGQVIAFGRKA